MKSGILQKMHNKKKILFVCMGNICRSPSAEAVFNGLAIKKKELNGNYEIDSAGTGPWHVGEPADKRMQKHAIKRGYNLTSIARQFEPDY
jgi:protein-tyrosine phosphatase